MNDPEVIAALERIEAKIDQILERLRWAPASVSEWYQSQQADLEREPLFRRFERKPVGK
jgi:hypothetical protein